MLASAASNVPDTVLSSTPSSSSSAIKVYTLLPETQSYKGFITEHIIPPLVASAYKGQMGRIGIVGGSPDYTGAPYYAAESALKFGADLSFVFCAKEAAIPIKSYSPELMVTPFYEEETVRAAEAATSAFIASSRTCSENDEFTPSTALVQGIVNKVASFFPRLHALVIGPGLGRNPIVLRVVSALITLARQASLPLVIDADGLYLVAQNVSIIRGYSRCILTPNAVEFDRLLSAVGVSSAQTGPGSPSTHGDAMAVHALSIALGGVTVVKKGAVDVISAGSGVVLLVTEPGSMRRCGGQGDVLAGCLGVASYWSGMTDNEQLREAEAAAAATVLAEYPCDHVNGVAANVTEAGTGAETGAGAVTRQMWAAALASTVTRRASARAFGLQQRAMTSPDVLQQIGPAFQDFCTGASCDK